MHDDNRPRRVVPKWRLSRVTQLSVEAKSQNQPIISDDFKIQNDAEISKKHKEFEISKSVPVAAELMFLAVTSGNEDAAKTAAKLILDNQININSSELIKTAKKVLDGAEDRSGNYEDKDFINKARKLLKIDYNNPILHTDIALSLTSLQKHEAARKYIRTALNLAPKSRFVTRAAARYYLHVGDHEMAHELLLRSPLLKIDPWIKASEIAVATLRGRTSANVKSVIRDFESGTNLKCTELLSAAATVELLSGGRKKAKALFKDSLKKPNDNSVAQAEWAAQRLNLVVDADALNVPLSFEANSHNAYRRQEINDAIAFAEKWKEDEPFATRPVDALCYLFSLEERYDEARECASLIASRNKNEIESALNLLFTRIMTGDLDTALEDYIKLGNHSDLKLFATHYLANGGALAYSLNDHEKGREFYMAAIKAARIKGEANTEALARAYFARMAIRSGDPQAEMIVSEAAQLVPRLPSAGAIYVIQSLANINDKKELNKIAMKRVAKPEWHWDALTNTLKQLQ